MLTNLRPASVALAVVGLAGLSLHAQSRATTGEWSSYGGTNWSQKYSPLDQITADNFGDLQVAWTWESVDVALTRTSASGTTLRSTPMA